MNSSRLISVKNLSHKFKTAEFSTEVLKGVSFHVNAGEMVAIRGASGSGKSTLLYLLGGLSKIQSGDVEIGGNHLGQMDQNHLALWRNQYVGFIFQQFYLLDKLSVLENIRLALTYPTNVFKSRSEVKSDLEKAREIATFLGLADRLDYTPQKLSGGQQQRVAIGRAMIQKPKLILADEPTGNLDSASAKDVLSRLKELQASGTTVIIITHDPDVAKICDREIILKDGIIESRHIETAIVETVISEKIFDSNTLQGNLLTQILQLIPIAAKNIFRHKLRSSLTMIGIILGIAAIFSMLTLGGFTKQKILNSYADLGVNTLFFYGYPNAEQAASDEVKVSFQEFDVRVDFLPMLKLFPSIELLSPLMLGYGIKAEYGGLLLDKDSMAVGINEHGLRIMDRKLEKGRGILRQDVENANRICVIGSEVEKKLFRQTQPVGQILRLQINEGTSNCYIVGVLKATSSNKEYRQPNLEILMPWTFLKTIASPWASVIQNAIIQVKPSTNIGKISQSIPAYFKRKYGKSGEFRVDSDSVLLGQMKIFLNLFTILLASIALLTLGVGGVGITNMMLVSISERLRDIGIRKALGATHSDIYLQFLLESLILCFAAGVIGLAIGFAFYEGVIFGATKFVNKLSFEWVFDPTAFFISLISILSVGIFAGLIPALKAKNLQVIEALRNE